MFETVFMVHHHTVIRHEMSVTHALSGMYDGAGVVADFSIKTSFDAAEWLVNWSLLFFVETE